MKFFYIMAHQFVTIFLSPNTVTTLHFDHPISYCDRGVSKKALWSEYRRKKSAISFVPKIEGINTNMTCFMRNNEVFVFNLRWSNKVIHKNLVIKKAGTVRGGQVILKTKEFTLYDAGKNYYIESNKKKKLIVNEIIINKTGVISKWSPLIINGKEYHL